MHSIGSEGCGWTCCCCCWFKQNLFVRRNNKLNKQVQEAQQQYAYLRVTYKRNDNYIYDGQMADYCQKSKATKHTPPKNKQTTTTQKTTTTHTQNNNNKTGEVVGGKKQITNRCCFCLLLMYFLPLHMGRHTLSSDDLSPLLNDERQSPYNYASYKIF